MTKKEEALQKIEELKEVIKNIEKEEEEKPKLYKGQLCYVWNDDGMISCGVYTSRYIEIKMFSHIDLRGEYKFKRSPTAETRAYTHYEPLPFDPRSCAPPGAVAYAVDDTNMGCWFRDRPYYWRRVCNIRNDKMWYGLLCTNEGDEYMVYDPIRGADPENSLIYWGDE
jgi:hypothetical protein